MPDTSVTRSSSVAPRGSPTAASQRGRHYPRLTPIISRPAILHKQSDLQSLCPVHCASSTAAQDAVLPSGAYRNQHQMRQSGYPGCVRLPGPGRLPAQIKPHLRLVPSSAIFRCHQMPAPYLFSPATATVLPSLPTPAVKGMPALMRHSERPVATSIRVTAPSAAAANRLPPASAGEKTKAPALPIETDHAVRTVNVGLKSTSSAGADCSALCWQKDSNRRTSCQ